jgi:hypothetical protein
MVSPSKTSTPSIVDRFKKWYNGWGVGTKDIIVYIRDLLVLVLLYGLLLAFMMSVLLPAIFPLCIKTIFAFGIGFYFLKEELPRIIVKSQIKSNK